MVALWIGVWWLCGKASDFRSRKSGFETTCCNFKTLAILFNTPSLCLSEDTLKAVGPSCPVSMQGEIKDPMQRNGKKNCCAREEKVDEINQSYAQCPRQGCLDFKVKCHKIVK